MNILDFTNSPLKNISDIGGNLAYRGQPISSSASSASIPISMWLDAANAVTSSGTVPASGQTVAHWIDKCGKGFTPTQSTDSLRPYFKTDAINGLPAIEFPGSGNYRHLVVASQYIDEWASAGAVEMLFVFRRLSSGGSLIATWNCSNPPPMYVMASYTDGVAYFDWCRNGTIGRVSSTDANLATSTNWIVLGARRDNDRSIFSVNGVDIAISSDITPLRWSATYPYSFYLGAYPTISLYGNCEMAEVKMWAGSLTATERSNEVNILRTKYSI